MEHDWTIDTTHFLAVTGILSHEEHLANRLAIRYSWMPATQHVGLLFRFVMRGSNASVQVQREAQQAQDIIFVPSAAVMQRSVAPLASLLGWFRIVVRRWPNAELYGKADDDIWLHPAGVANSLQASMASLQALNKNAQMYWGMMEASNWNTSRRQPTGFVPIRMLATCRTAKERAAPMHGPFYYVCGPHHKSM